MSRFLFFNKSKSNLYKWTIHCKISIVDNSCVFLTVIVCAFKLLNKKSDFEKLKFVILLFLFDIVSPSKSINNGLEFTTLKTPFFA